MADDPEHSYDGNEEMPEVHRNVMELNTRFLLEIDTSLILYQLYQSTGTFSSESFTRRIIEQIKTTIYQEDFGDNTTLVELTKNKQQDSFSDWLNLFSNISERIRYIEEISTDRKLVFSSQTTSDPLGGYIEVKVGLADGVITSYTMYLHFS